VEEVEEVEEVESGRRRGEVPESQPRVAAPRHGVKLRAIRKATKIRYLD
jgi:hypothetical protein